MVLLNMSPALPGERLTLGPAPWFRMERNELRQGPTESLVGELRERQWRVGGQRFAMVEATPGALLRFAGPVGPSSSSYGPYRELRIADGELYGDGRVVARFDDDTYLWRDAQTLQAWPAVVVSDANP